jgi:hypothetical protein
VATKPASRKLAEPAKRKRPKLASVASSVGAGDDAQFDRLIYERVRLGIMSALAVRDELTFTELKALSKYVTCAKLFEERRPKSVYRITPLGRNALNRYLDHVEAVIKATRRP